MAFEWDKAKAAANVKKHKVTFDEASTVFGDPLARIFDDPEHSAEERREIIVGHSILGRLLLVCFTEREGDLIRIFSAREATRKERQDYEENAGG
ncbi:MAG TPA: BrnT family toxin [Pyrinomonadaceae bacterium]